MIAKHGLNVAGQKHGLDEVISEALDVLKHGGLILYPTDTVWGIGCDATNEAAVQRVFALKRRAEAKSLVLLACDLDMVARYIRKIPSIAVDLVSVNDAPMTIVYPGAVVAGEGAASDPVRGSAAHPSQPGGWAPRSEGNRGPRKSADFWGAHEGGTPLGGSTSPATRSRTAGFGLAPSVVAADGSVGIRIPRTGSTGVDSKGDDWDERPVSAGAVFCNRLIYRLRRPLVSTSANISGEPAPASFPEISPEIRAGVDYIVPASVSGLALPGLSRSGSPSPASRSGSGLALPGATPALSGSDRRASGSGQTPSAAAVRFDDSATGRPSQILKLGLDGEVEIIRP